MESNNEDNNAKQKIDIIAQYQVETYISNNEAVWRILAFTLHKRNPAVVYLAVHLENGQRVYFTDANMQERAFNIPDTTMTTFFYLLPKR